MTKKLLILNGSHSEIPLIKAGKKLGFHVITIGDAPGLIGHKYSDEYHPVDYSDKDEVLEISKKLSIDSVCSCANDFGAITASYVSGVLGLSGHDTFETTLLLHHKDSFKKFSKENDIPTPHARSFDSASQAINSIDEFNYPLIVKPVDLTGGKGVSKVNNRSEFNKSVQIAFDLSFENRIVIEEFFNGTQHSLSSFVVNHKVVFYFSDNEFSFQNPYYVSSSAAPAIHIDKYSSSLVRSIETISKKLGLVDGVFHVQYLANGTRATIIDITRRCSGDLYPYPVNYATDIDWSEWIIRSESGMNCENFPRVNQAGYYGRHCVMSNRKGLVKDVSIDPIVRKYIVDELFWWQPGYNIIDFMTQKVGIVLLKYPSMSVMMDITKRLPDLIKINLV
ncbi:MAG: ATP-grasp domain-containing protein [gamma proteobacterium symbiont of Bathyaustriella thionipta]|nr:ATP-grasp domain-containing protein [gamma proteobacterium symbiont of Bathyaustriella thionipta]